MSSRLSTGRVWGNPRPWTGKLLKQSGNLLISRAKASGTQVCIIDGHVALQAGSGFRVHDICCCANFLPWHSLCLVKVSYCTRKHLNVRHALLTTKRIRPMPRCRTCRLFLTPVCVKRCCHRLAPQCQSVQCPAGMHVQFKAAACLAQAKHKVQQVSPLTQWLHLCTIRHDTVGDALITFNYERHALNFIEDHRPGRLQRVLNSLPFLPCIHQGRKNAPKLNGNIIAVTRYSLLLL